MRGPYKRNCLGLQKLSVSLSLNPSWFLQPEVMGVSLPGTGTLGWGGLVWVWDPSLPRGTSEAEIFLLIFLHHTWFGMSPSPSPLHLPVCRGFLTSLDVAPPCSRVLGGSECSLAVISMWSHSCCLDSGCFFPAWRANLIKITSYLQPDCDYGLETLIAEERFPRCGQASMV